MKMGSFYIFLLLVATTTLCSGNSIGEPCRVDGGISMGICTQSIHCFSVNPTIGNCSGMEICCDPNFLPGAAGACSVSNLTTGTCIADEMLCDDRATLESTCTGINICCEDEELELGDECLNGKVCTFTDACSEGQTTQEKCATGLTCCPKVNLPDFDDRCYITKTSNGTCVESDLCLMGITGVCQGDGVCCNKKKVKTGEMCDPMSFCALEDKCIDEMAGQGSCETGSVCCDQDYLPGKGKYCGVDSMVDSICVEDGDCMNSTFVINKPGLCNEENVCCTNPFGSGLACCNGGTYKLTCAQGETLDGDCNTCNLPGLKCCVPGLDKVCTYQVDGSRQLFFGTCKSTEACVNKFLQLHPVSINDDISGNLTCDNPSLQCCDE